MQQSAINPVKQLLQSQKTTAPCLQESLLAFALHNNFEIQEREYFFILSDSDLAIRFKFLAETYELRTPFLKEIIEHLRERGVEIVERVCPYEGRFFEFEAYTSCIVFSGFRSERGAPFINPLSVKAFASMKNQSSANDSVFSVKGGAL